MGVKPPNALRSGDWLVQSVPTHGEAVRFIRGHHYAKGAPNTSTYRHGLFVNVEDCMAGELMGVAMWLPPTRAAAEAAVRQVGGGFPWQGVLTLTRLAVHPDVPTNGASFLLGRSMRLIDRDRWPVFVTFADTALGHTGAIYRATNWTCDGPVAAGDTWVDVKGRQAGRKRGGRTLIAAEMRAAGYERRPHAPKVRFYHRAA